MTHQENNFINTVFLLTFLCTFFAVTNESESEKVLTVSSFKNEKPNVLPFIKNKSAYVSSFENKKSKPKIKKTLVRSDRKINFYERLYAIESNSGKDLFIPYLDKKGIKNCKKTTKACGHHQLTLGAIKDIPMCKKRVRWCMKKRLDFKVSYRMAKQYVNLLNRYGCKHDDWLMYASYQQGCSGINTAIKASRGKTSLSRAHRLRIARNLPTLSRKKALRLSSKIVAKKYLNFWSKKWKKG